MRALLALVAHRLAGRRRGCADSGVPRPYSGSHDRPRRDDRDHDGAGVADPVVVVTVACVVVHVVSDAVPLLVGATTSRATRGGHHARVSGPSRARVALRPTGGRTHARCTRRQPDGRGSRSTPRIPTTSGCNSTTPPVRRSAPTATGSSSGTSRWRTRPPSARSVSKFEWRRRWALELRGIIDRLELDDDGELVVTDYKTGRAPSPNWERKSLSGVNFYAFLCESLFGRRPAAIRLMYLSSKETITATPPHSRPSSSTPGPAPCGKRSRPPARRDDFRPGRARCATTAPTSSGAQSSAATRDSPGRGPRRRYVALLPEPPRRLLPSCSGRWRSSRPASISVRSSTNSTARRRDPRTVPRQPEPRSCDDVRHACGRVQRDLARVERRPRSDQAPPTTRCSPSLSASGSRA